MQQWEYHIELVDVSGFWSPNVDPSTLSLMLNKAGKDGWELVSMVDLNQAQGQSSRLIVTFKRPKAFN
ncbi:DUF4177 domain-containing protein [Herpetosiphon llansteffanensis]|uniref:DUF4177 domain-containing protein n=1 Tax=Herpetosiphon llansteffanensis TaxID=2094568 RepID=UPI0013E0A80D|nr:DUF4177 domain-containing protein [Herpetosiphon llansteffanensis]